MEGGFVNMITWTNTFTTMADAYTELCTGEDPWIALGNFTNDFFNYHADERDQLLKDPLKLLGAETAEQLRWATFCAAAVQHLCSTYHLSYPQWITDTRYAPLVEPWYFASEAALRNPKVKAFYELRTPESFKQRHIYCGDRIFQDKRAEAQKFKIKLEEKQLV